MSSSVVPSENRFDNVIQANRYMYEHLEEGSDVTINVFRAQTQSAPADAPANAPPPTSRESVGTVSSHMYIIKSRSPELAKKATANPSGKATIEVEDITVNALKEVLRHMYYDKVELRSGNVFEILLFCKTYGIEPLRKQCVEYIRRNITAATVCEILDKSIQHKEKDLEDRCTKFITDNTKPVLNNPAFLKTTDRVVDKIASLEYMGVTEIELFKKCVEWARSTAPEAKGKDLRAKLGTALEQKKFRFPTMSTQDFYNYVVQLEILTPEETVDIYNYFAGPHSSKPPSSFVTALRHLVKSGDGRATNHESGGGAKRTHRIDVREETPVPPPRG